MSLTEMEIQLQSLQQLGTLACTLLSSQNNDCTVRSACKVYWYRSFGTELEGRFYHHQKSLDYRNIWKSLYKFPNHPVISIVGTQNKATENFRRVGSNKAKFQIRQAFFNFNSNKANFSQELEFWVGIEPFSYKTHLCATQFALFVF